MNQSLARRRRIVVFVGACGVGAAGGLACWAWRPTGIETSTPAPATVTVAPRDADRRVEEFCSSCHVMPSPASFGRAGWRGPVVLGFEFAQAGHRDMSQVPSMDTVRSYFERRAPEQLRLPPLPPLQALPPFLRRRTLGLDGYAPTPGVSHVRFARLSPPHDGVVLVCDMRHGLIMAWDPQRADAALDTIAYVMHPATALPVDLDQDGWMDMLVANLGTFLPSDKSAGQVLWLRRDPDAARYEVWTLATGLGRVADVQPADFDGDGDLDLIVAAFGWRAVGDLRYFENQTTDWSQPRFRGRVLETKTGAIHVPVADLNADGRPDFVALFSQEHEQIIAFLNEGGGRFRQRLIFSAGNPAYGSTGIELVDFDRDGDLDVLYTNGDSLDEQSLKPYHGVQWLENTGRYPFQYHLLATMPGVHRALARDIDGDGDPDVVAAAFLPFTQFQTPSEPAVDSLLWLENREGQFVRHSLERGVCAYTTLDVADIDGDGDLDWITGTFSGARDESTTDLIPFVDWITVWEHTGRAVPRPAHSGP
jgi:hypothetical protein